MGSGIEPHSLFIWQFLPCCADSKSLLANCLTYQLTLNEKFGHNYEEYYAKSLSCFRRDVCDRGSLTNEATLAAGILLCFITVRA
jgi:hypothetical protein